MSRFDLFFVLVDDCNEVTDYNIARRIVDPHSNVDLSSSVPTLSYVDHAHLVVISVPVQYIIRIKYLLGATLCQVCKYIIKDITQVGW